MSGDLADRCVGKLFRPWAAGQDPSVENAKTAIGQDQPKTSSGPGKPKVVSGQERPRGEIVIQHPENVCHRHNRKCSEKPGRSRLTSGHLDKVDNAWFPATNAFCGHPSATVPTTVNFGLLGGQCPSSAMVGYGPCAPTPPYGQEVAVSDGGLGTFAVKQAKKQRPKRFPCPHCQVAFSNNGQLKGHVRIHTGERPFPCDFPDCGKTFTRNEELTRHKRIHLGLRPYACHVCGKKFGRKDHLKKHVKTHQQKVALPGALVMADPGIGSWPHTSFYHPGYGLGMHPHNPHQGMFNMASECGPFLMQWTT